MMMVIKRITAAIIFLLICWPCQLLAAPKVRVENPVFTFESIPEGLFVLHEFIIKNTGDTPLIIDDVLPP